MTQTHGRETGRDASETDPHDAKKDARPKVDGSAYDPDADTGPRHKGAAGSDRGEAPETWSQRPQRPAHIAQKQIYGSSYHISTVALLYHIRAMVVCQGIGMRHLAHQQDWLS